MRRYLPSTAPFLWLCVLLVATMSQQTSGQTPPVRIDPISAGLGAAPDLNLFGNAVAALGDLDGDGFEEVAVGMPRDDAGGPDRGAVAILFFGPEGQTRGVRKISSLEGGFDGSIGNRDGFGTSLAKIGDLDGDGVPEIAVGAPGNDDGGSGRGAVWILFLNPDGTVKPGKTRKISDTAGGFTGILADADAFGFSAAGIGDVNGDGVADLAVGTPSADDGRFQARGFVWILLLRNDGDVLSEARVDPLVATDNLLFGSALAAAGDVDGDGVPDLAVGAPGDDSGGSAAGSVSFVLLNADGTTRSQRPVFEGLQTGDRVGSAVARVRYRDQSLQSLIVGSTVGSHAETENTGTIREIILSSSGRLTGARTVGVNVALSAFDRFGAAVDVIGDLDGDGLEEVVVGAPGTDAGGFDRGAVWLVFGSPLAGPQISSVSRTPAQPAVGEPITIRAVVTDLQGIGRVDANLRRGGERSFFTSEMSQVAPGTFELLVPPVIVGPRGIDFFVSATNSVGISSRSPADGYRSLSLLVPTGDSTLVEGGSSEAFYRLFSIPMRLENPSARDLLEGSLGPYSQYDWRFFEYMGDDRYGELSEVDTQIEPGRAYWLLIADASRNIATGPGRTVETDTPFQISLRSGWNLVGNPFGFALPLESFSLLSDADVDFWAYQGEWVTATEPLEPFGGYAIFSSGADTLSITPDLSNPGFVSGTSIQSDAVRIRVSAVAGSLRDSENYAVLRTSGDDGSQVRNRAEPPRVGDHVTVYFESEAGADTMRRLSTEVRSVADDRAVWNLRVRSARAQRIALDFTGVDQVPDDFEVSILDERTGSTTDLRATPRLRVATSAIEPERFQLVVRRRRHSEGAPDGHALVGSFPNPFSRNTTILYTVAGPEVVAIEVRDLLGRVVAELVGERLHEPGEYTVRWAGTGPRGPAPSGVYILRQRVGGRVADTRTVVHLK